MKHKTIFVSVSAFNEEDLLNTLENAMATAKNSKRLFFGIFYHNTEGIFKDLSMYSSNVYTTSHESMLGVGVSRSLANQFYNGEDYYLQIDAHTIFDNWWDDRLIADLELIKNSGKSKKPIISYYLPSWIRLDDDSIVLDKSSYNQTLVWDHEQMDSSYWDIPIMSTQRVSWSLEEDPFKKHYGIAAQFLFSDGSFCKEIIPDQQIMFYGEEPALALRCFSAGYDVFTTATSYMWHKNKILSKNPNNDRYHFFIQDQKLRKNHEQKVARGLAKTKQILTGEYFGYWGAENFHVLNEYEKKAEFSFKDFYNKMIDLEDGKGLWYERR